MAISVKEDSSFITGIIREKDVAYVAVVNDALAEERNEHSVPLVWHRGEWFKVDEEPLFEWVVASIAVIDKPLKQGVFIGVAGEVVSVGSGQFNREIIQRPGTDLIGPLRGSATIDNKVYAVGMGREIYRRDGVNIWTAIDAGIAVEEDDGEFHGIDDIDGYHSNEIYVVGLDGEIWQFDGAAWTQLDSPTDMMLAKVFCAPNNTVYAGGQDGILITGRNDAWEVVDTSITDDIHGISWLGGKLYFATLTNVYLLNNDTVEIVDMGDDKPDTCAHLSAKDGILWSIGEKDVMQFDGKKWSRID